MNNYMISIVKKIECLFWNKEISAVIFVYDEYDEKLDQVLFFEIDDSDVVGVFIDGANPLFSVKRINEFDDFNLYANYQKLIEKKRNDFNSFKTEYISLVFSREYNELLGVRLSNLDDSRSLLLLFMHDEIFIEHDAGMASLKKTLEKQFRHLTDEDILLLGKSVLSEKWENYSGSR